MIQLIFVFLCAINLAAKDTSTVKTVLIARSNSWLENRVGAILTDSLLDRGYKVTTVNIKAITDETAKDYSVSIIFDALKGARIIESVGGYSQSTERKANILIFKITGEVYKGEKKTDAVSAATKSIQPNETAVKILRAVSAVLVP